MKKKQLKIYFFYREKLETDILAAFDDFLKNNEAKNILNYTRTPFIYLTMGVIGYIASSFFGMLYLTSLSSIFYLLTVCRYEMKNYRKIFT